MTALPSFNMSRTWEYEEPLAQWTQRHIPENLNPRQQRCKNPESRQAHLTQLCDICLPYKFQM